MKFPIPDKYILLGGGPLLAEFAATLQEAGKSVFVVTGERHSKETFLQHHKTLTDFLTENKIPFFLSPDINTDTRVLGMITEKTLAISFGAPWIFRQDFINLFQGRLLNAHGTRLPRHRGGGGFSWRILMGESRGCSLLHIVDAGVDTGDIVVQEEYAFPSSCRIPVDYENYSKKQYLLFLNTFVQDIDAEKEFHFQSQDERVSTYWPRLSTDTHGFIDWSWGRDAIDRFVCAFDDPYSGASTFVNENSVRLKKSELYNNDGVFHPFQKGLIYRKSNNAIFVATEEGSIVFQSAVDEHNTDIMHSLRVGDRLYTPRTHLEKAKEFRAVYTSAGLKNNTKNKT